MKSIRISLRRQYIRHIWLTALFFCLVAHIAAQERRVQNRPYIDDRLFHYGFFIGAHDQGLHLTNNGYISPTTGEQWMVENDQMNFGFSVGVLGDLRLTKWLSLRFLPSLHFNSKHLKFINRQDGQTRSQDMKSTYVGVPIDLKFSAPRFNNYRPYLLAGISPLVDLTTKKHTLIRTKPLNTSLEVGMGCDLYLRYFKLIPELKFSFGLGNILNKKRTDLTDESQRIFTESVSAAHTNMITLSFYFE